MIAIKMDMTTPCDSCPFRTDREVHLAPEVAIAVGKSLRDGASQPCLETVEYGEDGLPIYTEEEQHCAGALITMERSCQRTKWMKWMKRIGRYSRDDLDMEAPTYRTLYAFELEMNDRYALACVADKMKPRASVTP